MRYILDINIKERFISDKMSEFNIDEAIDQLVDKLSDQLKVRLKKLVERSEKQVLKQYIASTKAPKVSSNTKTSSRQADPTTSRKAPAKRAPKRESEYSDSEQSDVSV